MPKLNPGLCKILCTEDAEGRSGVHGSDPSLTGQFALEQPAAGLPGLPMQGWAVRRLGKTPQRVSAWPGASAPPSFWELDRGCPRAPAASRPASICFLPCRAVFLPSSPACRLSVLVLFHVLCFCFQQGAPASVPGGLVLSAFHSFVPFISFFPFPNFLPGLSLFSVPTHLLSFLRLSFVPSAS